MKDFNYETINKIWEKAYSNKFAKLKKQTQKRIEKAARQGKEIAIIPVKNIDEYTQIKDWLQTLGFFVSSYYYGGLRIYLDHKKGE
jgi:phage/plasmid-associated DNA primase